MATYIGSYFSKLTLLLPPSTHKCSRVAFPSPWRQVSYNSTIDDPETSFAFPSEPEMPRQLDGTCFDVVLVDSPQVRCLVLKRRLKGVHDMQHVSLHVPRTTNLILINGIS